ncbi:hypothetical protein CW745_09140 [Psychromonas sp. psych-6C06]|uniref:hypothetical protein n=1 Tax=Psychromonas sp. psych-6C06 TaxID=2058089 RepID=UPI000C335075|nr:hypothetical protein [Psychromonas sp. psych-6C06]PKF61491.1 hypothetical protein CW745_09140 [Psychromonas sp. psych-6C06]
MRSFSLSIITLSTVLLTACGGSLDGNSKETTTSTVAATSSAVATIVAPIVEEVSGDPSYFTYVGATPEWISIKGTGGFNRKETGAVTFKLVDDNGEPVDAQPVTFELSGPDGATIAIEEDISDSDGLVTTLIKAGNAAGPATVKVILVNDPTLFNTSTGLYISTGYPDQGSFSIGVDKSSVPGINHNDAKVAVTVNFADADGNNPIPDGTAVSFRAEEGRIEDKLTGTVGSCTTIKSECVMTWTSIGDMPSDGKVTVLAYALGVESFADVAPSNGVFDEGETYTDNAEVFHDTNYDGIYNDGEWFHDVEDASGPKDQAYTLGDGKYTGMQCTSDVAYCDQRFIHIYKQIEITATTDEYQCNFSVSSVELTGSAKQAIVTVEVSDMNNNTPAVDTVITASTTNGSISGDTSWTVPNASGPYSFDVELSADDETSSGFLAIKSAAPEPSSLITTCKLPVND